MEKSIFKYSKALAINGAWVMLSPDFTLGQKMVYRLAMRAADTAIKNRDFKSLDSITARISNPILYLSQF